MPLSIEERGLHHEGAPGVRQQSRTRPARLYASLLVVSEDEGHSVETAESRVDVECSGRSEQEGDQIVDGFSPDSKERTRSRGFFQR